LEGKKEGKPSVQEYQQRGKDGKRGELRLRGQSPSISSTLNGGKCSVGEPITAWHELWGRKKGGVAVISQQKNGKRRMNAPRSFTGKR